MPRSELRPEAGEREITHVEPASRAHKEGASGPVPEEEVRVEGRPLEGDETAELRPGDTQDEVLVTDDTSEAPEEKTRSEETRSEAETSEQADAEARRKRRAQERARRRRSTEDG